MQEESRGICESEVKGLCEGKSIAYEWCVQTLQTIVRTGLTLDFVGLDLAVVVNYFPVMNAITCMRSIKMK